MPELPEVETIRSGLKDQVIGRRIEDVKVLNPGSLKTPMDIVGRKIQDVQRRAKVLILHLDKQSLLIHLKMTGQVIVDTPKGRIAGGHPTKSMQAELPDRSTRVIFSLDKGMTMYFNDQRKFGWLKLVDKKDIPKDPLLSKVGPEPLGKDFTAEYLASKLDSSRNIKALILDQSIAAGIGNIYADEALHLAKIHPARRGNSLSSREIQALQKAIVKVLSDGVARGGSSFSHFVGSSGKKGDYLSNARVFRKEGQPCIVCQEEIAKVKIAGRGTHYCPKCQELK